VRSSGVADSFYNNFFVADVRRFLRADVQRLLNHIDAAGVMFTRRFGDLLVHSVAVQLLFERERVHHFRGWSYGHNSGGDRPADGRLYAGIFQAGLDAADQSDELRRMLRLLRSHRMGRALRAPMAAYLNLSTLNHGALTLARPGVCARQRQGMVSADKNGFCSCDHLLPTQRKWDRVTRRGNPARQWVLC
jgi:hypothetical protein